jgi:hypothetical protein
MSLKYPCIRCGKQFVKKETLKNHLTSDKICDTINSNMSREDYLKQVLDRNFNKHLKKNHNTAQNTFLNHSNLHYLTYGRNQRIPYVTQLAALNFDSIVYPTANGGYNFIINAFYDNLVSSIFIPRDATYVHVLYEENEIVLFKPQEFIDELLKPFIEKLRKHKWEFRNWCCREPYGYDYTDINEINNKLWQDVKNKFIVPINDQITVKYYKSA